MFGYLSSRSSERRHFIPWERAHLSAVARRDILDHNALCQRSEASYYSRSIDNSQTQAGEEGCYRLLYYLALMGMIGYTFQIGKLYGFATLTTYFMQLSATTWSYRMVGHGHGPGQSRAQDPPG